MGNIKHAAHERVMDDFKLNKVTARRELEMARGYGLGPDTTYHQKRHTNW